MARTAPDAGGVHVRIDDARRCRRRSSRPRRRPRSRRARSRPRAAPARPRRPARASGITSASRPGRASRDTRGVGRLSTRPSAPSGECSSIRTTARRKLGSTRAGAATRSRPRRLAGASSLTGRSPGPARRSRRARPDRGPSRPPAGRRRPRRRSGRAGSRSRAKKALRWRACTTASSQRPSAAEGHHHGGPDAGHVTVGRGRRRPRRRGRLPARRSTSARQSASPSRATTTARRDARSATGPGVTASACGASPAGC